MVNGDYDHPYTAIQPDGLPYPKHIEIIGGIGCQLRAMAVGGGGTQLCGAGAGSGYIEYLDVPIPHPSVSVKVAVGNHGQSSNISIEGLISITARPGQNSIASAISCTGGDGFSGGGAFCEISGHHPDYCTGNIFDGGKNGGDGEEFRKLHK